MSTRRTAVLLVLAVFGAGCAGVTPTPTVVHVTPVPTQGPTPTPVMTPVPTVAPTPISKPTPTAKPLSDFDAWAVFNDANRPAATQVVAAQKAMDDAKAMAQKATDLAEKTKYIQAMVVAMNEAVSAAMEIIAAVDSADIRPCFAKQAKANRAAAVAIRDAYTLLARFWANFPNEPESTFDQGVAIQRTVDPLTKAAAAANEAVDCRP